MDHSRSYPAKDLIIHCGKHEIFRTCLEFACVARGLLVGSAFPTIQEQLLFGSVAHSHFSRSTFEYLNGQRSERLTMPLNRLVESYTSSACSDIRDKVYGLRSLAVDCNGDDGLQVDDSKPATEIFFQVLNPYPSPLPGTSLLQRLQVRRRGFPQLPQKLAKNDMGPARHKTYETSAKDVFEGLLNSYRETAESSPSRMTTRPNFS